MLSLKKLKEIDRDLMSRSEKTRWQAAIALGEFAESDPESIWQLTVKHGSRRNGDVRVAIATCVLEHILEYHFEEFFVRVAQAARSNRWFAETAGYCWLMGRAELRQNRRRWEGLLNEIGA